MESDNRSCGKLQLIKKQIEMAIKKQMKLYNFTTQPFVNHCKALKNFLTALSSKSLRMEDVIELASHVKEKVEAFSTNREVQNIIRIFITEQIILLTEKTRTEMNSKIHISFINLIGNQVRDEILKIKDMNTGRNEIKEELERLFEMILTDLAILANEELRLKIKLYIDSINRNGVIIKDELKEFSLISLLDFTKSKIKQEVDFESSDYLSNLKKLIISQAPDLSGERDTDFDKKTAAYEKKIKATLRKNHSASPLVKAIEKNNGIWSRIMNITLSILETDDFVSNGESQIIINQLNEIIDPNNAHVDYIQLMKANTNNQVNLPYDQYEKSLYLIKELLNYGDDPITLWSEEQIKKWVQLSSKRASFEERIAVLSHGIDLVFHKHLRDVQLLAVICILNREKGHGIITEVKTGQGKSIIIAMLAGYYSLEKKYVDIITSSPVLADRDSETFRSYYNLYGFDCENNSTYGNENIYKKNIIYGTTHCFGRDILKEEFKKLAIFGERNNREKRVLIVDEVDNLFLDEASAMTYLAELLPGYQKLSFIFYLIWYELVQNHIEKKRAEFYQIYSTSRLEKELAIYLLKNREGIVKTVEDLITKTIIQGNKIVLDNYLKEIIMLNLSIWVKSAFDAYLLREGEKYKYDARQKLILPVDMENTGVIRSNSQYSNGLHQFLEIKHKLMLSHLTLITNYSSNIGMFRRYIIDKEETVSSIGDDGEIEEKQRKVVNNNIIGVTGTIGSKHTRNLLQNFYHPLLFVEIPQHESNTRLDLPPIIVKPFHDFNNVIYEQSTKFLKQNRVVLIICKTINHVEELCEIFDKKKVNVFKFDDNEDQRSIRLMDQRFTPGSVLIATNLAGRGFDLKLSEDVNQSGGLHVLLTFIPNNERILMQAFGRAARCGQKGSAQLLVQEPLQMSECSICIDDIIKQQDQETMNNLNDNMVEAFTKEKFFKEFCEIKNKYFYGDGKLEKMPDELKELYKFIEEKWGRFIIELDNLGEIILDKSERLKAMRIQFFVFKCEIIQDIEQRKIKNSYFLNRDTMKRLDKILSYRGQWRKFIFIKNKISDCLFPGTDEIQIAIDNCSDAIKRSPYDYIAPYYKAIALLHRDEYNTSFAKRQELIQNNPEEINPVKLLQSAMKNLTHEIFFWNQFLSLLELLNISSNEGADIRLSLDSFAVKIAFFQHLRKVIHSSIEFLISNQRRFTIVSYNLEELFGNTTMEGIQKSTVDTVLRELSTDGLEIFEIRQNTTTRLKLFFTFLAGFGLGAWAVTTANWGLGFAAYECFSYCFDSIITGTFSWKEVCINVAVAYLVNQGISVFSERMMPFLASTGIGQWISGFEIMSHIASLQRNRIVSGLSRFLITNILRYKDKDTLKLQMEREHLEYAIIEDRFLEINREYQQDLIMWEEYSQDQLEQIYKAAILDSMKNILPTLSNEMSKCTEEERSQLEKFQNEIIEQIKDALMGNVYQVNLINPREFEARLNQMIVEKMNDVIVRNDIIERLNKQIEIIEMHRMEQKIKVDAMVIDREMNIILDVDANAIRKIDDIAHIKAKMDYVSIQAKIEDEIKQLMAQALEMRLDNAFNQKNNPGYKYSQRDFIVVITGLIKKLTGNEITVQVLNKLDSLNANINITTNTNHLQPFSGIFLFKFNDGLIVILPHEGNFYYRSTRQCLNEAFIKEFKLLHKEEIIEYKSDAFSIPEQTDDDSFVAIHLACNMLLSFKGLAPVNIFTRDDFAKIFLQEIVDRYIRTTPLMMLQTERKNLHNKELVKLKDQLFKWTNGKFQFLLPGESMEQYEEQDNIFLLSVRVDNSEEIDYSYDYIVNISQASKEACQELHDLFGNQHGILFEEKYNCRCFIISPSSQFAYGTEKLLKSTNSYNPEDRDFKYHVLDCALKTLNPSEIKQLDMLFTFFSENVEYSGYKHFLENDIEFLERCALTLVFIDSLLPQQQKVQNQYNRKNMKEDIEDGEPLKRILRKGTYVEYAIISKNIQVEGFYP